MSLCGLHRRLRGAIVGHLALFEMTSSIPNRRYATGLRRLGLDDATPFFDEHVEADAVHEAVAAVDLAGGLARAEPELAADILWGASALALVERRWADGLLGAWARGAVASCAPRYPAPARRVTCAYVNRSVRQPASVSPRRARDRRSTPTASDATHTNPPPPRAFATASRNRAPSPQ